ncbi:hypothetical protein NGB25_13045 [Staphylococcus saprophyticus]|uniref:hypothetical protein n=1 Tax=Staphylococcus saprophyticus TaxID=29385 RepID=UPI002DBD1FA3|nr:hypothetical protein [Staphylococcus saprophyticus]MEB7678028.1 hypothetical protein [Staphylococcus saprophyticus]
MEKQQEVYNDLHEVVERGSYFNAYVMNENKERRNEVSDIKTAMSELDKLDELEKVDKLNSVDNLESKYENLSNEEIKEVYKELYEKQENMYLYNSNNNIYDDKILSQQYLDNTQKLNYLEENIVDTTSKYELQADVKNNIFNVDRYEQKIEDSNKQYQQLTQQLYEAKTNNLDKNDIEQELFDKMANKKLYSHNQKFMNDHKDELKDINNKDQERLKNRKEQSKSLDNLYSKDIMWKIVEEQGKNNAFLNKDDENVLDARANANTINTQKANNNKALSGSNQVIRNKSYNNAYTSLNQSNRINNTNYIQDKQNDSSERNNRDKSDKSKGISR